MKEGVKTLLDYVRAKGEEWEIKTDNTTEFAIIYIRPDGYRDVRSIKAYPGNETASVGNFSHGTGRGCHIIGGVLDVKGGLFPTVIPF